MNNSDKRKLKIVEILTKDKFRLIQSIADELDVTERTIRRDLEYLRLLNLPIRIKKGNRGGIYWDD